jgi:predicted nucleotidyltransferase
MDRDRVINLLSKQRSRIDQLGVKTLSVFGSTARGESQPDSDVDILVEFEGKATFDRYMELKFLLEDLLGTRIDLVTRNALRPEMRSQVEKEALRVA